MLGIIEILEEENNCSIENESFKSKSTTTPKYIQEKFNKMFIQYGEAIKVSNEKKLKNTNK